MAEAGFSGGVAQSPSPGIGSFAGKAPVIALDNTGRRITMPAENHLKHRIPPEPGHVSAPGAGAQWDGRTQPGET